MMREARKLERQGFGGAAESVALAASQRKLTERPGFSSADSEIARARKQSAVDDKAAAIRSGFGAQDSRQKLFADMQARAASGMTGAEGAAALAGFRSRASQLGVAPERFEATASGKLGIDLRSMAAPAMAAPAMGSATATMPTTPATTASTPTTTPTTPAATTPVSAANPIVGEPTSESQRMSAFTDEVRKLTAADGANMTRKDAVEEANRQRLAAGKAPLDAGSVINTMLAQSRAMSRKPLGPAPSASPEFGAVGPQAPATPASGAEGPEMLSGPRAPAGWVESVRAAGGAKALTTPAAPTPPTPTPASAEPQPQGPVAGLLQQGRENIRGTAFEGSPTYRASEAVGEFVTETTPEALRKARNRASSVAQTASSLRQAARGATLEGAKKATRGTGFEGSKIDRRIFGP